jgi:hypothetical protein
MITYNFPPTSRYYGIQTTTLATPQGPVAYLKRRFLPDPAGFALLQFHTVSQGQRLDNIAARYMDAEAFWRIADSNAAMRPQALAETVGRKLRITLPQGVPGTPNA